MTLEEAAAAPGRKVLVSGEQDTAGGRGLAVYALGATGAKLLAATHLPVGEHAALLAELQARGLAVAESDEPCDFVWVRTAAGVEVYDDKRLVLDATGDRAVVEGGRVVRRTDITSVIAFSDDDYTYRGLVAVMPWGEEVPLVSEASRSAMYDPTYSRNELLFETGWCSTLGRVIAAWAGVGFDDHISMPEGHRRYQRGRAPTAFDRWLDARDGEAIARAWAALAAERPVEVVEIREPGWWLTSHAVARFAAEFLGWSVERLEWLTMGSLERMPEPVFAAERETRRSFLEQSLDDDSGCESISIHEERDGGRGVQHIRVLSAQSLEHDYVLNHATQDGAVDRVFDRATATGVSITSHAVPDGFVTRVAKIGAVELCALDLYGPGRGFELSTWSHAEPDDVRELAAQLASEVGPGPYTFKTTRMDRTVFVDVDGLPWGYQLQVRAGVYAGGVSGGVTLRLPLTLARAVVARLARVPGAIVSG